MNGDVLSTETFALQTVTARAERAEARAAESELRESRLRRELQIARDQVALISSVNALISAALLGALYPAHPYEGKPVAPVEEALRVRRTMERLAERVLLERARGRYDVTEADVFELIQAEEKEAAKEIPITYAPAREPEKGPTP